MTYSPHPVYRQQKRTAKDDLDELNRRLKPYLSTRGRMIGRSVPEESLSDPQASTPPVEVAKKATRRRYESVREDLDEHRRSQSRKQRNGLVNV